MINNYISPSAIIGNNVTLGFNCIIEEDVVIGANSYIDSNTIIRKGTKIGNNAFIGANCVIGEYCIDYIKTRTVCNHQLVIGKDAIIRSGSIIYTDSTIGDGFNTGHNVTIREKSFIGNHVSVGTVSDIQGNCKIGDYVRMHSNVHIGQLSKIDSFVWIYPYVCLTNDPTPPSDKFVGVHVHSFAVVATSATIMPGIDLASDSLVAAGATVSKDVEEYSVVGGTPAKVIGDIRNIKNHFTGKPAYPWREAIDTYMPWSGMGYNTWHDQLTQDERDYYGI